MSLKKQCKIPLEDQQNQESYYDAQTSLPLKLAFLKQAYSKSSSVAQEVVQCHVEFKGNQKPVLSLQYKIKYKDYHKTSAIPLNLTRMSQKDTIIQSETANDFLFRRMLLQVAKISKTPLTMFNLFNSGSCNQNSCFLIDTVYQFIFQRLELINQVFNFGTIPIFSAIYEIHLGFSPFLFPPACIFNTGTGDKTF